MDFCVPRDKKQLLETHRQDIDVKRQCELLGIGRSTAYYQPRINTEDIRIMNAIDEIYTERPYYGKRRIRIALQQRNIHVGVKKVRSLMRRMGLEAIYPKPKTSIPNVRHRTYPYLLKGLPIVKSNQVWSTDITYIRLLKGFIYLVAVIDWFSRYVISWRLSITMEKDFCIEALEESLSLNVPDIFNSDQGSQFTSPEFTGRLEEKNVRISMDGKGRCLDNIFVERFWRTVKYEDIYLRDYSSPLEVQQGLKEYFRFYNHNRPHQSLDYKTPAEIYFENLP